MEQSDSQLEAMGYRYVFGYDNPAEESVVIEVSPWRYTNTSDGIYWDTANDFWVFTYYLDSDGTLHFSPRRHLDGNEDTDFNPADFIGVSSRSAEHIIGIYNTEGLYIGKSLDKLEQGVYLIRTSGSSYKIYK